MYLTSFEAYLVKPKRSKNTQQSIHSKYVKKNNLGISYWKNSLQILYFLEEEEDSPLEQFLEALMEILDPNGPIATPVATIGVLGKSHFENTQTNFLY